MSLTQWLSPEPPPPPPVAFRPAAELRQDSSSPPRDSLSLRQLLAQRAGSLVCERLMPTDGTMRMARVDSAHCPRSPQSNDACYLLSQDELAGSVRALDCLALRRERGHRNLPAFHAWGFVSPACWSYVQVRHGMAAVEPSVCARKHGDSCMGMCR